MRQYIIPQSAIKDTGSIIKDTGSIIKDTGSIIKDTGKMPVLRQKNHNH